MKPILSASFINCHAIEMDSIVFKETAPMIRAFIARPGHTLWRNHPVYISKFSVAIHQHRQDITMVPICGEISNVFVHRDSPNVELKAYEYDSQILNGQGGFKRVPAGWKVRLEEVRLGMPTFVPGPKFHTVYVPKGQTAAWLICEGAPNQSYSSYCFTNSDQLELEDFSAFYKPMTEERLAEDLLIMGGAK